MPVRWQFAQPCDQFDMPNVTSCVVVVAETTFGSFVVASHQPAGPFAAHVFVAADQEMGPK